MAARHPSGTSYKCKKGGDHTDKQEVDTIKVAVEAGKQVLVHAEGSPSRIVAVGVAAGITVVAVGVGYGIYKGGDKLIKRITG